MGTRVSRTTALVLAFSLQHEVGLADVAPGDVITAAEAERVRGLIPEALYPYAVQDFADLRMEIVETRDYTPHPSYVKATADNACKPRPPSRCPGAVQLAPSCSPHRASSNRARAWASFGACSLSVLSK